MKTIKIYYFDSSALIKKYINEKGTNEMLEICRQDAKHIFSSKIAIGETLSVLNRKLKKNKEELHGCILTFCADIDHNNIDLIDDRNLVFSIRYLMKYDMLKLMDRHKKLDAGDAWHFITMKQYLTSFENKNIIFVSADDNFCKSVFNEGYKVYNPIKPNKQYV